jgi:arginine deiminase
VSLPNPKSKIENRKCGQAAEWLPARVVLMCEPRIETLFSILQTDSTNFLFPFSLAQGREEHRAYRQLLESHGVQVIDFREALISGSPPQRGGGEGESQHERLQKWAHAAVSFDFHEELTAEDQTHIAQQLDAALAVLDAESLVDVILLRPKLQVRRNDDTIDPTTRFVTRFVLAPASPYYTRDPLMTTREGVVITKLRLEKRQPENDIAAHVLESLGITPIYRVTGDGTLEGGDFIPCGDFVLQGQGLLTNAEGVRQCLANRVYGRVEVAVVKDPRGNMDEMHLDTYFAMLDKDLAACVDTRLSGEQEPEVDVWVPHGDQTNYDYKLARTLLFSAYLEEKGIHVLPFSKAEQDDFAANGLLIAPRTLIGVTRAGQPFEERLRAAGVETHFIAFDALIGGYGGPHCSSQVILRG